MDHGIYSGVAAMDAAEKRMGAIAANLANLSTTAYKRRNVAATQFERVLHGRLQSTVKSNVAIDFRQGELRETGNAFDLALRGDGFFTVDGPGGQRLTRCGRFHVGSEGTLLSLEGYPVAWEGGRGTVDTQGVPVSVDPSGTVWQGDSRVGQLRVVDVADRSRLIPEDHGYFRVPRGTSEAPAQADVLQGSVESSNVSAVDEMVALVAVQRSFEGAARLLSMIDQSYRRLSASR